MLESVTAHAEKGAGTKTTLLVRQEEEDMCHFGLVGSGDANPSNFR